MNWCRYCGVEIAPRLNKAGMLHGTQPTHCCPEHARRSAVWDSFIDRTRERYVRGDTSGSLFPPATGLAKALAAAGGGR